MTADSGLSAPELLDSETERELRQSLRVFGIECAQAYASTEAAETRAIVRISKRIRELISNEREQCAKIAEANDAYKANMKAAVKVGADSGAGYSIGHQSACFEIAARIREGSEK